MIYITDKQLEADIRNMDKGQNSGRSVAMMAIEKQNQANARKRQRNKEISRARARLLKKGPTKLKAFGGKNEIIKK